MLLHWVSNVRVDFISYRLILFHNSKHPENINVSVSKGNNKITELRTILQRESQNS
jgi:hypothetical protein